MTWYFWLYWIQPTFYIQDFLATCACPENFTVLKYMPFTFWIFEQLALALKNRVCPGIFTVLNIFFIIQDFWTTCETEFALKFFSVLNIFFIIQDFWTTCACHEKQRVTWNFSLYWNILYHGGFLSNLRLPWKFSSQEAAALPDHPLRTPMHKIIGIGNFVRGSLSERDQRTLLFNSRTPLSSYDFRVVHTGFQKRHFQMQWLREFKWVSLQWNSWKVTLQMVCCVRLHLMLSAKALGMLVKSAHRIGKKRKKTGFAQRRLMGFLNFANMKETWTWEICFATVEKNHRSKQNSAETSNQVCRVLRSSGKNIKETRCQFSWNDPQFSTVNCLSTNYVPSLPILITSNFSFSRLLLP